MELKKTKCLYVSVSNDKYRLIENVADSVEELSNVCGVSYSTIYKSIKKFILQERKGIEPNTKYEVVRYENYNKVLTSVKKCSKL